MTNERPPIPEAYLRKVDGRVLGNRRALAHLLGKSLPTVANLARTDREFPTWVKRGPGPVEWYDLRVLEAYAAIVRDRKEAPSTAAAGDDVQEEPVDLDEVLPQKEAAPVVGVTYGTFRGYVMRSRPFWEAGEDAPLLPRPVEGEDGEILEPPRFRRGDLLAHKKTRPGRGVGGGRGHTRAPAPASGADPDELIGGAAAAAERGTGILTFRRLVAESEPRWAAGEDAPIPVPDAGFDAEPTEDARAGYRWKRRTLRSARPSAAKSA